MPRRPATPPVAGLLPKTRTSNSIHSSSINIASCTLPVDTPVWSRASADPAQNHKLSLPTTWEYHVGSTSSKKREAAMPARSLDRGWRRGVVDSDLGGRKIQGPHGCDGPMGDVARWRAQTRLGAQFQLGIGSQDKPRLLEQGGRRNRRRARLSLPGASIQHCYRFARTDHCYRSRRRRRTYLRFHPA